MLDWAWDPRSLARHCPYSRQMTGEAGGGGGVTEKRCMEEWVVWASEKVFVFVWGGGGEV